MNYVFLSPHFPPHYYLFSVHLRNLGVNVLGLADEPDELLRPELKSALNAYYRVPDLHNYDSLVRALGWFTHGYGKLDGIDSLNEYWLETEARLRTDFNMPGLKADDLPSIKRKSEMKKIFATAGVDSIRGQLIRHPEQARDFAREIGFPLVVKPDIGVGAARTYRLNNWDELNDFLARSLEDYIVEEFVSGSIETFDGLTDHDGRIVFYTSHRYSEGVMEIVLGDNDMYYYSVRDIPADLEQAGRRIARCFDVRARFFHFEFFRMPDGRLIALEVNMRPPGGMTTDMFNYANDIDIYHEWANVIVNNRFDAQFAWPYYCGYVARKSNKDYAHPHDEIVARFGERIVHYEGNSGVIAPVMGDYGYLVRTPDRGELDAMFDFILAKR